MAEGCTGRQMCGVYIDRHARKLAVHTDRSEQFDFISTCTLEPTPLPPRIRQSKSAVEGRIQVYPDVADVDSCFLEA